MMKKRSSWVHNEEIWGYRNWKNQMGSQRRGRNRDKEVRPRDPWYTNGNFPPRVGGKTYKIV
jgi:hypothetical protein